MFVPEERERERERRGRERERDRQTDRQTDRDTERENRSTAPAQCLVYWKSISDRKEKEAQKKGERRMSHRLVYSTQQSNPFSFCCCCLLLFFVWIKLNVLSSALPTLPPVMYHSSQQTAVSYVYRPLPYKWVHFFFLKAVCHLSMGHSWSVGSNGQTRGRVCPL